MKSQSACLRLSLGGTNVFIVIRNPHPSEGKKTLLFLPRRMRRAESEKEDTWCQGSRPASKGSLGAVWPRVWLRTKEQGEFYEPYLLLGPKVTKEEEGRKQINSPLFDYRTLKGANEHLGKAPRKHRYWLFSQPLGSQGPRRN